MDDFDFLDDDILDEEDLDFNDLPLDDEFIRTHFNTISDNGVIENFPFVEDDIDAITDYVLFSKGFGYLDNKKADKEELSDYVKKDELPPLDDFVTKDTQDLTYYTKTSDLSSVALTGDYDDLIDKPELFSGDYNDLTNKPTIPTKTSDLNNDSGFITKDVNDLTNYTLTSSLSSVATSGSYNDLSNKPTIPDVSNFITKDVNNLTYYTLSSNLASVATSGSYNDLSNTPTIPDVSNFITKDVNDLTNYTLTSSLSSVATSGSYNDLSNKPNIPPNMTILSYGSSTWNDFITAYNSNSVVYCRASSNSNPATGSQTRLAFMAYVNNSSTPTEVEFQYYRSVSTHSDSQQGDQVFIYKLTSSGTWSVLTRNTFSKVVAGTNLSSSYSNGVITLNNTLTVPTIESISQSDFINTVGSGVTIAQFNVCHIGKYISGTIQLQYSSDIVNSDTYPFSIKNYIPVNGYVSYCALGSTQWKIESPGYIYIDPSRWVLKNDTGRTGLRWATISFSYMSI